MAFDPGLKPGDEIKNEQLVAIFKCGNMDGMRRSLTTNTLAIISDHTKGLYEDRWEGPTLHYAGMGPEGDQDVGYAQNRTLAESNSSDVEVFLFEVFQVNKYQFHGRVRLSGKPYQERQPDKNGALRSVWMFPVQLLDRDGPIPIETSAITDLFIEKVHGAQKLDSSRLRALAEAASGAVGSRQAMRKEYTRNPFVAAFAKARANGICQLCDKPAPFNTRDGEPFLEVHHIEWLSKNGKDEINNTVALCANCHRRMHMLDNPKDRVKLQEKIRRG